MKISEDLERIRHQYFNRIVETKAKSDFDTTVEIFGKKIGPYRAGNHYKMEFWIAKSFLKRDILKLVSNNDLGTNGDYVGKLDVQEIQKLAFDQGRTHEINPIGKNLFTAIKEYMDVLSYRVKKNLTPEKKFKSLFSNIQDLMTIRHRKILNLSQMKQSFRLMQNLTEEEKVLMHSLTNNFSEWKDFFQKKDKS